VTQERFTSLDREIERRMDSGRVEVRSGPHRARIDESTLLARLQHLGQLRLAERVTLAQWTLAHGWQKCLRELGERGDVPKQIGPRAGVASLRPRDLRRLRAFRFADPEKRRKLPVSHSRIRRCVEDAGTPSGAAT
jgi:uncharacterized protein DUF3363